MAKITDKIFSKTDEAAAHLTKADRVVILEIAYLAVAADRQINEHELVALRRIAKTLDGADGIAQSEQAIDNFMEHGSLNRDRADARLRLLATELTSHAAKRVAYKAAYALASSDDESSDEEFEFDLQLIDALGLDQSEVDALVHELA
jgi:tellurite resistance protein